ncbi:MAG: cation:dicarboxylase symporter family transporter [gamma proteobacterium symbiont of Bathyaustriella thionipta]|nr:cation:dicarboxylase symporter family transporter [gamma proteobacterium symbiont of Bathyaustriella thionipta]
MTAGDTIIFKISPFQRVILSLVAGIIVGLLLGNTAGKLEIVGTAYIRLLQMTVLPYILFSLIGGLGQLNMDMARRIGMVGAGLILFLWTTTMIALLAMPLAFPDWTSASFFSSSLISQASTFDPVSLYIPANVFQALANTVVPAVVVFSISMGIALISVTNKDGFLLSLQNVSDALMKIASFIAKLAPIGIFALSAAAAGTLDFQALTRLQVYLWVYAGAWLVLTFFTLPMFVAWATPFSYREVMQDARTALVTAFAAGTVLVVLPMIIVRSKALLAKHGMQSNEATTAIDVLVPTAYSFPSVGTLMGIAFILFAGWFVGSPLDISQYPDFVITGAISAFGTMAVALPFMLDYFHLPSDLFQLYLLGSVMTARFATVLATMHAVIISLLGASAMLGMLKKRGLLQVLAATVVVMALFMWGLGFILTRTIPYEYTGYKNFIAMPPMETMAKEKNVQLPDKLDSIQRSKARLGIIEQRGSLRVGYPSNALPFAFRGEQSKTLGFDIDLMRVLAKKLGVGLELVQIRKSQAQSALNEGRIDLFVGALIITAERARNWTFSEPYLNEHIGFIVPDYRRSEFSTVAGIEQHKHLRIAVLKPLSKALYAPLLERNFDHIEIVPVASVRAYMTDKVKVDGMIYTAESAAAWTLVYPEYSVVVPQGLSAKVALGMVLPAQQPEFEAFINLWLEIEKTGGLLDKLETYWIYGKTSENTK